MTRPLAALGRTRPLPGGGGGYTIAFRPTLGWYGIRTWPALCEVGPVESEEEVLSLLGITPTPSNTRRSPSWTQ